MFLPQPEQNTHVGVRGVRFKQFETALAQVLSSGIRPSFQKIPPRPSEAWPFDVLPPEARAQGTLPTHTKSGSNAGALRAKRKEWQIQSLLQCVLAMLPRDSPLRKRPYTIVDFGGGSGHLSIPLALLFPYCEVVLVDLKASSLRLVHEKALQFSDNKSDKEIFQYPTNTHVTQHDRIKRPCRGIPNLFTFHGSMEVYSDVFDMGVSLHACGESSDLVLRACARVGAPMVVAPCCVGKLSRRVHNPYVYHATGSNHPTIAYPQSHGLKTIFSNNAASTSCNGIASHEDWDAITKAADYSDWDEMRSSRNATRRTAKALVETDRMVFLQEQFQYCTALVRMDPWEASPKHDIVLAWRTTTNSSIGTTMVTDDWSPFKVFPMIPDDACNADIQMAWNYLLESSTSLSEDSVDWSLEELKQIESELHSFIDGNEREYRFPTRMGGRKRKLIHYLAHQLGLRHWPDGSKDADKTVVVAKNKCIV